MLRAAPWMSGVLILGWSWLAKDGLAPVGYLALAVLCGVVFATAQLLSWRQRNLFWSGLGFIAGVLGMPRIACAFAVDGWVPEGQGAGLLILPLLLLCSLGRGWVMRFCKVPEESQAAESPAPDQPK